MISWHAIAGQKHKHALKNLRRGEFQVRIPTLAITQEMIYPITLFFPPVQQRRAKPLPEFGPGLFERRSLADNGSLAAFAKLGVRPVFSLTASVQ